MNEELVERLPLLIPTAAVLAAYLVAARVRSGRPLFGSWYRQIPVEDEAGYTQYHSEAVWWPRVAVAGLAAATGIATFTVAMCFTTNPWKRSLVLSLAVTGIVWLIVSIIEPRETAN